MPDISNKSLILASSYVQYSMFIKAFGHSPMNHRFAIGDINHCRGLDRNMNVIILPGYYANYPVGFMEFIYHRFYNLHYIEEDELRSILNGQ